MEQLIDEGVADGERVLLLGFSQTCALNFKFAFTHPRHLRGAIGICGGILGDWDPTDHYKSIEADVLHLSGARDGRPARSPPNGRTREAPKLHSSPAHLFAERQVIAA